MRKLYSENKNSNTTIVNGENGTYSSITTKTTEESRTVEAKTYNNDDNIIEVNRIIEENNNNNGRRISTESQLYDEDGRFLKEKAQTEIIYNINGKLVEKKSTKTYYSEENGNQIEYTENYYYSYDKDIIEEEKIRKIIDPNSKHPIQLTSSKKIYSRDGKLKEEINESAEYPNEKQPTEKKETKKTEIKKTSYKEDKIVEYTSTKSYYGIKNGYLFEITENYYYDKDIIKKEKIEKTIDQNSKHLIQQTSSKKIYSRDGKLIEEINERTDYPKGKKRHTVETISYEDGNIRNKTYIEKIYSNYKGYVEKETQYLESARKRKKIIIEYTSERKIERAVSFEEFFNDIGIRKRFKATEITFDFIISKKEQTTKEIYETDGIGILLSYEYSIRKPGFSYHINATEDSNKPECYIITLEELSSKSRRDKTPTKTTEKSSESKNSSIKNEQGLYKVSFNVSKERIKKLDKEHLKDFIRKRIRKHKNEIKNGKQGIQIPREQLGRYKIDNVVEL